MKRNDKANLFENMISDLTMNFSDSSQLLEPGYEEKSSYHLPVRLQVIAEGFAKKWSLEQLNHALQEKGCDSLYARSFYESGLIFAFSHQMSYGQWKELFEDGGPDH